MPIGNRGVELEAGEAITLRASATTAATAGTNGTAVFVGGERLAFIFYLDITVLDTDAGDTLDVYIDWSLDNSKWYNGCHFPQAIGTGSAVSYEAIFGPSFSAATTTTVTSDVAVGVVRPEMIGPYVRARWVMVDADANGNFTWSLKGYAF